MSNKPIIDISKYNVVRDWGAVKNNVNGVIMRLGYTGYGSGKPNYDPKFLDNLNGCKQYDIPYSIYYFPASINDGEAIQEANFILNAIKDYDLYLSFPIFLDSEIAAKDGGGRADNLDRFTRTRLLMLICDKLKNAGYNCGIYASKSWFDSNLDDNQIYTYVYKWIAQYNTSCTYQGIYHLWQYACDEVVAGITGAVDCSRIIRDIPKGKISETVKHEVVRLATTVDINIYDQFGERLTGWTLQTNCY